MEFLDLTDATDSEKREIQEILSSTGDLSIPGIDSNLKLNYQFTKSSYTKPSQVTSSKVIIQDILQSHIPIQHHLIQTSSSVVNSTTTHNDNPITDQHNNGMPDGPESYLEPQKPVIESLPNGHINSNIININPHVINSGNNQQQQPIPQHHNQPQNNNFGPPVAHFIPTGYQPGGPFSPFGPNGPFITAGPPVPGSPFGPHPQQVFPSGAATFIHYPYPAIFYQQPPPFGPLGPNGVQGPQPPPPVTISSYHPTHHLQYPHHHPTSHPNQLGHPQDLNSIIQQQQNSLSPSVSPSLINKELSSPQPLMVREDEPYPHGNNQQQHVDHQMTPTENTNNSQRNRNPNHHPNNNNHHHHQTSSQNHSDKSHGSNSSHNHNRHHNHHHNNHEHHHNHHHQPVPHKFITSHPLQNQNPPVQPFSIVTMNGGQNNNSTPVMMEQNRGISSSATSSSSSTPSLMSSSSNTTSNVINNDHNNSDGIRDMKKYDRVCLGGTFDNLHVGHKRLLREAVMRCGKSLTVGVTDKNMIKNKILWELIKPVEDRIKDVREFLMSTESNLEYRVVPIKDPFGPAIDDSSLTCIVVSEETIRGGKKINEIRRSKGMKELEIVTIDLIPDDHKDSRNEYEARIEDEKVSSSTARIRSLGTLIREPKARPELDPKPYLIGLTGGIASGKSSIAEELSKLGAGIIDCDKIAHKSYEPGSSAYDMIIQTFGPEILDDKSKSIDRRKLGTKVFSDVSNLRKLESITWPATFKLVQSEIQRYKSEGRDTVIIEATKMIESKWIESFHQIWVSIIPEDEAIKRLKVRNNLNEDEAKKRIHNQITNSDRVKHANVVFCTLWDREFTKIQVLKAWKIVSEKFLKKI